MKYRGLSEIDCQYRRYFFQYNIIIFLKYIVRRYLVHYKNKFQDNNFQIILTLNTNENIVNRNLVKELHDIYLLKDIFNNRKDEAS